MHHAPWLDVRLRASIRKAAQPKQRQATWPTQSLGAVLKPFGTTQNNSIVVLNVLVGLRGRVVDASFWEKGGARNETQNRQEL